MKREDRHSGHGKRKGRNPGRHQGGPSLWPQTAAKAEAVISARGRDGMQAVAVAKNLVKVKAATHIARAAFPDTRLVGRGRPGTAGVNHPARFLLRQPHHVSSTASLGKASSSSEIKKGSQSYHDRPEWGKGEEGVFNQRTGAPRGF